MHQKLTMLIILLTLALTACNPIRPLAPNASANSVIFTAEQSQAQLYFIAPNATGAWQPSAADVAQLEADLPAFLQSAENPWLRTDPPIWERAPDYMRQYLGIVENGQEVIYANFFCSDFDLDWQEEFVLVMDGGDCYFQVKYNPTTGEFYDFSVNGES